MRPRLTIAAALAVLAVACGGNGPSGTPPGDDDTAVTAGGERPVQVVGAGRTRLAGTLTVPPTTGGGSPTVLIVPAVMGADRDGLIGATGRNDDLGKDLAKAFADAGLSSYRYDARGTGESKLDAGAHLALDDVVLDARAALDVLAQRTETAGRDLTVVGYDTGGLIALRLAAADDRVKRLVLISTPGRSLVEVQAAAFESQYGPASADALRSTIAGLLATRTLPPLDALRSEFRTLLPQAEAAFLADLYALDPAADAARVRARTLIVVPGSPAPYAPERLAGALGGPELLTTPSADGALLVTGLPPPEPTDSNGMTHAHGVQNASARSTRDTVTVDQITAFLSTA